MYFWKNFWGTILIVIAVSFPVYADSEVGFSVWLQNFRHEAVEKGISQATLEAAFAEVAPLEAVLELDRRQPEKTIRFEAYRQAIVHPARIKAARAALRQNRAFLADASEKSGVPISYILALWGVESDFGREQGKFAVIPALATLAFEGRRRAFFTKELMAALQIIDQGDASLAQLRGSWAGAMGQPQFMPSTYLNYAQDGDGDGKRDIWTNPRDVFASICHYLAAHGWRANRSWGQEVRVPPDLSADWIGLSLRKPLAEWAALGITRMNGKSRPFPPDSEASLIMPDGPGGGSYLVYDAFHALMAWNRSIYFATAVGLLADRIEDEENGNGRLE